MIFGWIDSLLMGFRMVYVWKFTDGLSYRHMLLMGFRIYIYYWWAFVYTYITDGLSYILYNSNYWWAFVCSINGSNTWVYTVFYSYFLPIRYLENKGYFDELKMFQTRYASVFFVVLCISGVWALGWHQNGVSFLFYSILIVNVAESVIFGTPAGRFYYVNWPKFQLKWKRARG
jgi:hypothetical protein